MDDCWTSSTDCGIVSFLENRLPEENVGNAILGFDYTNVQLLSVSKFMDKTEFLTKAMNASEG